MKWFFALTLVSSIAVAAPMPEKLHCTSKARSEVVQSFSLLGLNSTRPDSSIDDGGFMGMKVADGMLEIGFSNECDNGYDVKISLSQIDDLVAGKRTTVTGELSYGDVYLFDVTNEEVSEETVEITCKLTK